MKLEEIAQELAVIRAAVETLPRQMEQARARETGLLGYDGLRERLAVDGKLPCLRTVKNIARRHKSILRPVPLGHRTVGFRPVNVDRLLAHLAGETPASTRQL